MEKDYLKDLSASIKQATDVQKQFSNCLASLGPDPLQTVLDQYKLLTTLNKTSQKSWDIYKRQESILETYEKAIKDFNGFYSGKKQKSPEELQQQIDALKETVKQQDKTIRDLQKTHHSKRSPSSDETFQALSEFINQQNETFQNLANTLDVVAEKKK